MLPQDRRPMTGGCCCGSGGGRSSPPRRGWEIAAGAASLGVWAFLPKCPMCVAAYVALWTGLGLSLAAAAYLRWSLLLVSAAVLIYLVMKRRLPALAGGIIRRVLAKSSPSDSND
jgi:hypothetical protein